MTSNTSRCWHSRSPLMLLRSFPSSGGYPRWRHRQSLHSSAQKNPTTKFSQVKARLENIKPYNVNDGLPEDYMISFENPHEPVGYFFEGGPRAISSKPWRWPCKLLGGKLLASSVMHSFGLGRILHANYTFHGCHSGLLDLVPLLLHLETDLVRQKMGGDGKEYRKIEPLTFFQVFLKYELLIYLKELLYEDAIPEIPAMLSRLHNFLEVGPLVLTSPDPVMSDPQCCLEWLDKQKRGSVVYVCFGSMVIPPPHELAVLAEALEDCDSPFLWSVRDNPAERFPEGFLERTKEKGKVVSWSPQLKVLQHNATGVFLTHAGWNSITESIVGCVPNDLQAYLR
ncbi:hypothetical protein OIU84_000667 [Salix udensis]|uniref:Uncharacterized protein n=1 Tax=Salix udensis TaxID=889485 RepID=A0AAD6L5E7_9ROSI|nr:hypothetical protein OIU84_000667 [Salix udensis]